MPPLKELRVRFAAQTKAIRMELGDDAPGLLRRLDRIWLSIAHTTFRYCGREKTLDPVWGDQRPRRSPSWSYLLDALERAEARLAPWNLRCRCGERLNDQLGNGALPDQRRFEPNLWQHV